MQISAFLFVNDVHLAWQSNTIDAITTATTYSIFRVPQIIIHVIDVNSMLLFFIFYQISDWKKRNDFPANEQPNECFDNNQNRKHIRKIYFDQLEKSIWINFLPL